MLDDTGFVERMEYSLANSPSLVGQRVKRAQEAVSGGIDDAIQEATKSKAHSQAFKLVKNSNKPLGQK